MSRREGSEEGAYATRLQNNTPYSYGRAEADCQPGLVPAADTRPGVGTRKKPKDLRACESEDGGHGEGSSHGVCYSATVRNTIAIW